MSPERRRRNHEDPLSIFEATYHINQLAFPMQMAPDLSNLISLKTHMLS